jgi:hypothetical protein
LADLGTRSAGDLNSGTLPDARFPSALPAISGVNLTNLNANNLASGTVPAARLDLTLYATKSYADSLVVGLLDDRGNYNASGNVFPSSGGSGPAGAIMKGDLWTISVGGTLGTLPPLGPGDVIRALTDSPGQTSANWAEAENNFGYVALNQALADGKIYIGNGSGIGTAVTPSGDVTITNAGVTAIGALRVTNVMIANSAIDLTAKVTGVLPGANGGTGQSSYAVGDLLYASGASALSKLADVATGNALLSGGVTAAPAWGKVGLTTHVSGILPSANGGTGIAFFAAAGPTALRTYTFPDANASVARTDAAQTFTGTQTFGGDVQLSAATANLLLKDANTGWQVSSTTVINPQANNSVRSTSFTSGLVGWSVNAAGDAEFSNVNVRGAIRSAVFVYNALLATSGTLGVFKAAGKLKTDVTITAAPTYGTTTFTIDVVDQDGISHASSQLFVVNDILRLKDGLVGDTWLKVTAVSDQTTFWRYTASIQAGTANVTYRAGLAVADYGQSGAGFIIQTADQANSPYLQMATHAATFSSANSSGTLSVTAQLRVGNLNGAYGYSSDVYGFGAGQYGAASKAWVTVDPTNGIRLGSNTTVRIQLSPDGSGFLASSSIAWDASGNATISGWSVGASRLSSANLYLDQAGQYISIGSTPPTSYLGADGIWMGKSSSLYKVHVGTTVGVAVVPTDIPGCKSWLKADSLVANDGDAIQTWTDSSGAGTSPTQATVGKRPLYKTNIVNGKPVLRFDGVDDFLKVAFTLNQPHTRLVVYKLLGSANQASFDGNTSNTALLLNRNTSTVAIFGGSVDLTANVTATAFHVIAGVYNGAGSKISVDGGTPVTGNPGSSAAGGISIGAYPDGTFPSNIDVAEVLEFDSALSDAQVLQLHTYLGDKYGITVTTPTYPSRALAKGFSWDGATYTVAGDVASLSLSGAAYIAIGATPPTSASAGTGLWIDRTGIYGLAAGVVQAKFDAATGKITAGAGAAILDSSGITLVKSGSVPTALFLNYTPGTVTGRIGADAVASLLIKSEASQGTPKVSVEAYSGLDVGFYSARLVLAVRSSATMDARLFAPTSTIEFNGDTAPPSGGQQGTFIGFTVGADFSPTAMLDIVSDKFRLRTAKTPASSGAAGNQGDICWDANFIYVCYATNTWKRATLAAF